MIAPRQSNKKCWPRFSADKRAGMLSMLVSDVLGVQAATIRYEKDDKKRRVEVAGVTEVEVEMLTGHRRGQLMTISGVNDMDGRQPLGLAVVRSSTFKDYGMEWDNTGKNSFYST